MVPSSFVPFFTTTAGAAAALIGLLFVSITLRPETVFGPGAGARGHALADKAFTGLANTFFLSLAALVPSANVGIGATVIAVVSLASTLRLQRHAEGGRSQVALLALSLGTFLTQLFDGVALLIDRHDDTYVYTLAYIAVASMGVALIRAWMLLQGKHVTSPPGSPAPARPGA